MSIERLIQRVALVAVAVGCGPANQQRVVLDLVEALPVAEVLAEQAEVVFGTAAARPHLEEGWSLDEQRRDGTTFVWATGNRSVFRFYCSAPRDLAAHLRCAPFVFEGAPAQVVDIGINGRPVAAVEIRRGIREYTVVLPASALTAGINRLVFSYSYSRSPRSVRRSGDDRNLSVAWERIRFDGLNQAATPSSPVGSTTLVIPNGAELAYFVKPPTDTRFCAERVRTRQPGGGALEIRWRLDRGKELLLARTDAAAGPIDVELPGEGASPGRLALRAVGEAGGGFEVDVPMLRVENAGGGSGAVERVGGSAVSSMRGGDRPSVLVYLVDTLRADRLGCYGGPRGVSPHIDRLASQGALFEHTLAPSSWTKPSVASVLTGLDPLGHGVNHRLDRLPAAAVTIAELFREQGYLTAGFTTNAYITEEAGFAQGFEHFEFSQSRSEEVTAGALEWLRGTPADAPFFLYVHTIDPHAPYEPSGEFRRRFAADVSDPAIGSFEHIRALGRHEIDVTDGLLADLLSLYDAEVAENDHAFGGLLDGLRELGRFDDTVIVFVSDHGEEFHEHGVFGHGWDLYSEVLDVPMIIRPPSGRTPIRVGSQVRLVDLPATVLEAAGLEVPDSFEGASLWPQVVSRGRRSRSRHAISYMDYEGRRGIAVVEDGWKLIQPLSEGFLPGAELYRLGDDPEELDDLSVDFPIRLGYLQSVARVEQTDRSNAPAPERLSGFDDATAEALEALGYIR